MSFLEFKLIYMSFKYIIIKMYSFCILFFVFLVICYANYYMPETFHGFWFFLVFDDHIICIQLEHVSIFSLKELSAYCIMTSPLECKKEPESNVNGPGSPALGMPCLRDSIINCPALSQGAVWRCFLERHGSHCYHYLFLPSNKVAS